MKKFLKIFLIIIIILVPLIVLGVFAYDFYGETIREELSYKETINIYQDTIKCLRKENTNEYGSYGLIRITDVPEGIEEVKFKINYFSVDCIKFLDKDNVDMYIYIERNTFKKNKLAFFYIEYSDNTKAEVLKQCTYLYDLKKNLLTYYYANNSYDIKDIAFDDIYTVIQDWTKGYLYYNKDNLGEYKYKEINEVYTYEDLE